jgi:uncharacterized protein (TIGR02118 family)
MTKIVTVFRRRAQDTRAQFRDYYEGHHVAMGLAANRHFGFTKYVRNHVVGDAVAGQEPGFDCLTEFTFGGIEQAVKAQAFMLTPEGKALAEDELNFLDMSHHPSFAVEETVLIGPPRTVDPGMVTKYLLAVGPMQGSQALTEGVNALLQALPRRSVHRLTLDRAEAGPAGDPPFAALLTLWPAGDGAAPAEFCWSLHGDWWTLLKIDSLEAPPDILNLG